MLRNVLLVLVAFTPSVSWSECSRCETELQSLEIRYVIDDNTSEPISIETRDAAMWQLRDYVPVFDLTDERLAPNWVTVVLGEPSQPQVALPTALGQQKHGVFINDEPELYSFEELEHWIIDLIRTDFIHQ